MNFSEFKLKKGAEPLRSDPELEAARREHTELDAFASRAEAFEPKLRDTLMAPGPDGSLIDSILAIPEAGTSVQPNRRWWAMAASVLVLLSAGVLTWQLNQPPPTLEEYLLSHYRHDGARVLQSADEAMDRAEVRRMLASLDLAATDRLAGQVAFIKFCPTTHGRGAHMIVRTQGGPVTVILMPGMAIDAPLLMEFDNMDANVFALQTGSAAIIGPHGEAQSGLATLLQDSLSSLATGT